MKKYIAPEIEVLSFYSEDVMVVDASVVTLDPLESVKNLLGFKESAELETASNGYNGPQAD